MDKIIVVDFSGTLINSSVAEEANSKRYGILNLVLPSEDEHKKLHGSKGHYDILREQISELYGIKPDMDIEYVASNGEQMTLPGKDVLTYIMTDLFRMGMYAVAQEQGKNIFREGMIETLQELKNKGYKLALVSGVRQDIISGMLRITECPFEFDYVCGQDPILSKDTAAYVRDELSTQGTVAYTLGDKVSDFDFASALGAKAIFIKGGHPSGGEEEQADYTISSAKELLDIIK